MTTGQDGLSKAEAVTVATIEAAVPALDEAHSLLSGFQVMIHERRPPDLDTWIWDWDCPGLVDTKSAFA